VTTTTVGTIGAVVPFRSIAAVRSLGYAGSIRSIRWVPPVRSV